MDWFIERLGQASPTFDYRDLREHAEDFKKLLDLKILKYVECNDSITCDLCDGAEHEVSPFKNAKGLVAISCAGGSREVDLDELRIWMVDKYAFAENIRSKDSVIEKEVFESTVYAAHHFSSVNRYVNVEEMIKTSIGIEIQGKRVSKKNGAKFPLNPTDRAIVYFLYSKFQENSEQSFAASTIAREVSQGRKLVGERYVIVRISDINGKIRALIVVGKTNIDDFIKNERGRGYRLNPIFFRHKK